MPYYMILYGPHLGVSLFGSPGNSGSVPFFEFCLGRRPLQAQALAHGREAGARLQQEPRKYHFRAAIRENLGFL